MDRRPTPASGPYTCHLAPAQEQHRRGWYADNHRQ
jgi:hypothetical protein